MQGQGASQCWFLVRAISFLVDCCLQTLFSYGREKWSKHCDVVSHSYWIRAQILIFHLNLITSLDAPPPNIVPLWGGQIRASKEKFKGDPSIQSIMWTGLKFGLKILGMLKENTENCLFLLCMFISSET